MNEALAYLVAVPPPLLPGEYLEVRGVHPLSGTSRAYCSTLPQTAATALAWSGGGAQVWVGINPRQGRASGDAAVRRVRALPADIDVKLWEGDTGAMHAAVDAFPVRPSLAVLSGSGLQVYWLLEAPAAADGRPRAAADRLARALVGQDKRPDLVGNAERLLRLPGTYNHKYTPARPVALLWSEPHRYRLADLETWLAEHAPWTAPPPVRAATPHGPSSETFTDFNLRFDVPDLLCRHGARVVGRHGAVLHLGRPGKADGISATFGYYPGILHVFTTEWPPFEAAHGYDAVEVFTRLEHGGDYKAAHAAAVALGYGTRLGLRVDSRPAREAVRQLAEGAV
jgi:hypothetical protein